MAIEDVREAPQAFVDGRRALQDHEREPAQTVCLLSTIAGTPGVVHRQLEALRGELHLALPEEDRADGIPRLGDPPVVPPRLEQARVALRRLERGSLVLLGVEVQPHEDASYGGASLDTESTDPMGRRDGLGEHLVGGVEVELGEREAEVGQDRHATLVVGREELDGSREEVRGGGDVPPSQGSPPRGREVPGRPLGDAPGGLVDGTELRAVAVRLREVIAGDLLELRDPFTGLVLEPRREPLVQVGPLALGQRPVRGVADQDVSEGERILVGEAGTVRPDQVLPEQRLEVGSDPGWRSTCRSRAS